MHKILGKLHIHVHILPAFLINFINILAKVMKYKEPFKSNILKTVFWGGLKLSSVYCSLCSSLILNWNTTSFYLTKLCQRSRGSITIPLGLGLALSDLFQCQLQSFVTLYSKRYFKLAFTCVWFKNINQSRINTWKR